MPRIYVLLLAFALQPACLITDAMVSDAMDRDDDGEKEVGDHGIFGLGTDCDDRNPNVAANLIEVCGDGLDNDCDGFVDGPTPPNHGIRWYNDRDGDGHATIFKPTWSCTKPEGAFYRTATDCDDNNRRVHAEAEEVCDGLDNDCDGIVDEAGDALTFFADEDGDGHGDPEVWVDACTRPEGYLQAGTDCDDADPDVNPDALEVWYDGVDQDCAGGDDHDQDGDGASHPTAWTGPPPPDALVDCDDTSARIRPGAPEVWYDGVDQDCDPDTEWDQDGDGLTRTGAPVGLATDCDDERVTILGPIPRYLDADGDGFGDPDDAIASCTPLPGRVDNNRDCEDLGQHAGSIHPGAFEACNSRDDDCDGTMDDGAGSPWWPDADGDGFGDRSATSITACLRPTDYAGTGDDCDDQNVAVNPGAPERCTGRDDNCNGLIDDVTDAQFHYWFDNDGDGHGDESGVPLPFCPPPPPGWVRSHDDCDDDEPLVFLGNPEACDHLDNDCDGAVDEGVTLTHYADVDGDGFGRPDGTGVLAPQEACAGEAPAGFADNLDDCDDSEPAVHPDAVEVCDDVDNDCVDGVDHVGGVDLQQDYWTDADGDSWGDENATPLHLCPADRPSNTATRAGDCDDLLDEVHPAHTEICDYLDNDCNGRVDRIQGTDLQQDYWPDLDGDGWGDEAAGPERWCPQDQPEDSTTRGQDCDDAAATAYPGRAEVCDYLDNDCEGTVDLVGGADLQRDFYLDFDGDAHGDEDAVPEHVCPGDEPTNHVEDHSDCDDDDRLTHPGADEGAYGDPQELVDAAIDPRDWLCDGLDNDCNPGTMADPPEGCGVTGVPNARFDWRGSRYLLMSETSPLNAIEAEEWCELRGYHLLWLTLGDLTEHFELATLGLGLNTAIHVGARSACPGAAFPHEMYWYDPHHDLCTPARPDLPSNLRGTFIDYMAVHNVLSNPVFPDLRAAHPVTGTALTLCEREIVCPGDFLCP
jgi:hypothetical protein